MAPPKTRSRDRSSLPKYRVELPILLDDMNLSVYAFRLYVHLKRVAERSDEGSCWESARTLATACNMSSGKVSEAKDELEQKGLITRHPRMLRGGIGDDIIIVDIWPENFARYAPESGTDKKSDHHTITSPSEVITTRSLSESDHLVITSGESDHQVIASTSKRSPGDPIDHDQYHIESLDPTPTARETKNGVGDDDYFHQLRKRGVGHKKAKEIAARCTDQARILAILDNRPVEARDPQSPAFGKLLLDILDGVADTPVPRARARAAPLTATRPNLPEVTVAPQELLRQMREKR